MTLIVHAPNVHQGGGRTLLLAILDEIQEDSLKYGNDYKVILDSRLLISGRLPEQNIAQRVRATLVGRLLAEWQLYRIAKPESIVLCFGNLPPLFKSNAHVCLYIQNVYLVSKASMAGFSLMVKIRIHLERIWLKQCIHHADEVIVQSESMQHMMIKNLNVQPKVIPFMSGQKTDNTSAYKKYDFLYAASGEPHKNHRLLIEAWKLLASRNIFPSLCLTISKEAYPHLCKWLESEKEISGLQISNIGVVNSAHMQNLYLQSSALIYPSTLESFGLPLIEARRAGLSIVASELDYVRDIVNPEQSFDPKSPVSIARAVERFLGVDRVSTPIISAYAFTKYLLEKNSADKT